MGQITLPSSKYQSFVGKAKKNYTHPRHPVIHRLVWCLVGPVLGVQSYRTSAGGPGCLGTLGGSWDVFPLSMLSVLPGRFTGRESQNSTSRVGAAWGTTWGILVGFFLFKVYENYGD